MLRYTKAMTKTPRQTKGAKKSGSKMYFEPDKMTFAIAALAAVTLVLLAVIASFS
jgi:hypothetical protein